LCPVAIWLGIDNASDIPGGPATLGNQRTKIYCKVRSFETRMIRFRSRHIQCVETQSSRSRRQESTWEVRFLRIPVTACLLFFPEGRRYRLQIGQHKRMTNLMSRLQPTASPIQIKKSQCFSGSVGCFCEAGAGNPELPFTRRSMNQVRITSLVVATAKTLLRLVFPPILSHLPSWTSTESIMCDHLDSVKLVPNLRLSARTP
jgi:hypothetical protein